MNLSFQTYKLGDVGVCVGQVPINEGARTTAEVSGRYPEACYFESLSELIGLSEQLRGRKGPSPVQATSIVLTVTLTLASLYLCLINFRVSREFGNKFPCPKTAIVKT